MLQKQVKTNEGTVGLPKGPGLGITPDADFIKTYKIA